MGQSTSALWDELWRIPHTEREYKFEINGVIYESDSIIGHTANGATFEQLGIGGAYCGALTLQLEADEIPRGATIRRHMRLVNGNRASEWIPKGVFYTNRRRVDDGVWTIEAFDSMRKAEVEWIPDQALEFPMTMPDAVNEFCRLMGVELDERTVLNPAYTIDYPASGYTIRNELSWIAGAHAGNFVMTDAGKLRLISLLSAPAETNNLVTEHGDAIIFGGVRILV